MSGNTEVDHRATTTAWTQDGFSWSPQHDSGPSFSSTSGNTEIDHIATTTTRTQSGSFWNSQPIHNGSSFPPASGDTEVDYSMITTTRTQNGILRDPQPGLGSTQVTPIDTLPLLGTNDDGVYADEFGEQFANDWDDEVDYLLREAPIFWDGVRPDDIIS
jgi:hypothetical protein